MSSLTELPELPEQDLPRLEDVVQDDAQPEAQEPAPPEEAAVDEDQYTFYDVPEDGDDLYTLPDA